MARDVKTIRIESILGGHSPTTHFAAPDQFRASLGIDPYIAFDDYESKFSSFPSGLLRPVGVTNLGTTVAGINWFVNEPKTGTVFAYGRTGSIYTVTSSDFTGLGDLTDGGSSSGNGAAYYDNYVYFARDTTIARYGPLDGTPAFTDDYWSSTLGMTAMANVVYQGYPNHILHRHSDGRLYILDTVSNQGALHYISTTKTTVEGDTNNGSKYNALTFGYGLHPTAIESYGSDVAVALVEAVPDTAPAVPDTWTTKAKIAFWDTTSTNINKITWVEFSDQVITGLKNVNGVLYVFAGALTGIYFKIYRFVGGYTFEEVYSSPNGAGAAPQAGAIDANLNRLFFGSLSLVPEPAAVVYSIGLQGLHKGLFCPIRTTGPAGADVSALKMSFTDQIYEYPVISWRSEASATPGGIDTVYQNGSVADYSGGNATPVWWSQTYRIGQPFKIIKVSIPLVQAVSTDNIIDVSIYTDGGSGGFLGGTTYDLTRIDNTNYPGKNRVVFLPNGVTGNNSFWLELRWPGTALITVDLPITIEYELIDD